MGETLTYAGKIENLPPQIEKPLANFVQESGSRMIMIVPMFENDVLVREQGEEAEQKRRKKRTKAIGCIVVEQVAESEPVPQLETASRTAGRSYWCGALEFAAARADLGTICIQGHGPCGGMVSGPQTGDYVPGPGSGRGTRGPP